MATIIAHHGTVHRLRRNPQRPHGHKRPDWIFFTESETDAWYFAGMPVPTAATTRWKGFSPPPSTLTEAEDLSEMERPRQIIAAAAASTAPVIILPDMSGVSEARDSGSQYQRNPVGIKLQQEENQND